MLTITIRDLCEWDRDGTAPEWAEPYSIYRFRDGEFVLYVGKTARNILERLYEHIGIDGQTGITKIVEDNLPESLNWEIDLFTVRECIPLIKKYFKVKRIKDWDTDSAEKAMIQACRPALNSTLSYNSAQLPLKYTKKSLERQRKTMLEFPPIVPKAE